MKPCDTLAALARALVLDLVAHRGASVAIPPLDLAPALLVPRRLAAMAGGLPVRGGGPGGLAAAAIALATLDFAPVALVALPLAAMAESLLAAPGFNAAQAGLL